MTPAELLQIINRLEEALKRFETAAGMRSKSPGPRNNGAEIAALNDLMDVAMDALADLKQEG